VNNPFVAGTVTVTMEMSTRRKVAVKVRACMRNMELQLQFLCIKKHSPCWRRDRYWRRERIDHDTI
jgi:hypothetical protein